MLEKCYILFELRQVSLFAGMNNHWALSLSTLVELNHNWQHTDWIMLRLISLAYQIYAFNTIQIALTVYLLNSAFSYALLKLIETDATEFRSSTGHLSAI